MTVFSCPQCGAPVSVSPRISFHSCEYCNTTSFIDRSGVMFYYLIPFIIEKDSAEKIFARWLKNPRMAKDLHTNAKIKNFKHFPVYLFTRLVWRREKFTRPARGTLIEGIETWQFHPVQWIYDNTIDTQNAERIGRMSQWKSICVTCRTAVSQSLYFDIPGGMRFNGETWRSNDGSSQVVMLPVSCPFITPLEQFSSLGLQVFWEPRGYISTRFFILIL